MIQTHPSTAIQAKQFTAGSLSWPQAQEQLNLTPPASEAGSVNGVQNGASGKAVAGLASNGNGVAPTTPAATPGAAAVQGASGIIPTLQYVSSLHFLAGARLMIFCKKKYCRHCQP